MSKISRWTKQVSHQSKEVIRDVANILSGYREFKKDGKTPEEAYFAMRRLYRTTNGRFNDLMGQLCKLRHRKQKVELNESLFDDVSRQETQSIARQIQRDGFFKFERQLSKERCDNLLTFSLETPGRSVALDTRESSLVPFDRSQPQSVRHQLRAEDLIMDPTVQEIATDAYFFDIAQHYLGFNPVFDLLSMWWSAPGDAALQSRAAQLYHFDMDRFRFVKFFIYLTDVGPDNGPHCYVRGSHVRKPKNLLRDERISDEEIATNYPAGDLVELTGPVGTILAVDTRGFHKGKPLTRGDRLIFQIQFADSLFGQNYPPIAIPDSISDSVSRRFQANERCFSGFMMSKQKVVQGS